MGWGKYFMGLIGSNSHPSVILIDAKVLRRELLSSALGGRGVWGLPASASLRGSNSGVPKLLQEVNQLPADWVGEDRAHQFVPHIPLVQFMPHRDLGLYPRRPQPPWPSAFSLHRSVFQALKWCWGTMEVRPSGNQNTATHRTPALCLGGLFRRPQDSLAWPWKTFSHLTTHSTNYARFYIKNYKETPG